MTNEDRQYEAKVNEIVMDFLKSATPLQRHQLVAEWNHDSGYDVFNCIVDDPETDKATALMMYWTSGGGSNYTYENREDMLARSSWDRERFDLIEKLEAKYMAGFYKNHQFAYDPTADRGYDWVEEWADEQKREMPAAMLTKLDGAQVEFEAGWIEGVPSYVHEKISQAYKEIFGG